jgi:hypothetical protein
VNLPERQQPVNRHPVRHSSGLPDWAKSWLKVETVFALVIGLGMAVWQLQRHWAIPIAPPTEIPELPPTVSTAPSVPKRPPADEPQPGHIGGKPLIVSGKEQQQMIVGVTTFVDQGDKPWLAAWSSEGGRLRWRWPLPTGTDATNSERASWGGSILLRTAEAVVRLDAESGRVVWTGPAHVPRGRLCATKAYVGIRTDKAPTRVLDWETGRPFDVKPGACETLYSSEDAGPNFQYLAASTLTDVRKRPKDFVIARGLLPKQGNARVILGTSGADATPAVSVVANGRWVWQQNVSAYTAAQLPEPPLAAVRRESVVVPFWDTQNQILRLAAFNLGSGARLWEAALSEQTAVRAESELDVSVTLDGIVVVVFDGRVNAYALSTGALQWSIGR